MSNERPTSPPTGQRRSLLQDRTVPRSPAEALQPRRGVVRPRDLRERKPPRKLGPQLRAFNGFLTFLAVMLAFVGLAVMAFEGEVDRDGPLRTAKTVVIGEQREGTQEIAKRLEAEGVISNAYVFVAHYLTRSATSGADKQRFMLKAGEYNFEAGASIREVVDAIGKGRAITVNITIPEGLTSWQIVERLRANQNLTGDVARVPVEGSLMPDTYNVRKGATRASVIETMQAKQREIIAAAWAKRQQGLPVRTPEEAIILASIIEKETGSNDERQRVAAVFVNRLKKQMRLQSDPTILYGLAGGQVQWGKPITRNDINSRTPHNTYVIAALPPTPICNPGRLAIQAALNPATTNELYFVANGQGGHIFSETLKDHNAAVQNWRKAEKEMRARQAERQAAQAAAQTQGQASEVQVPAQVLAAEMEEPKPTVTPAAAQPSTKRGQAKRN